MTHNPCYTCMRVDCICDDETPYKKIARLTDENKKLTEKVEQLTRLRDRLQKECDDCAMGDRPMSPPVWKLRMVTELNSIIYQSSEHVTQQDWNNLKDGLEQVENSQKLRAQITRINELESEVEDLRGFKKTTEEWMTGDPAPADGHSAQGILNEIKAKRGPRDK